MVPARTDIVRLFQSGIEHVHSGMIVLAAKLAKREAVTELLWLALAPPSGGQPRRRDSLLLANGLDHLISNGFESDVRVLLDHPDPVVRKAAAMSVERCEKTGPFS